MITKILIYLSVPIVMFIAYIVFIEVEAFLEWKELVIQDRERQQQTNNKGEIQ